MAMFEFIFLLLEIFQALRFALCVAVGIGLTALILNIIPYETLAWMIAGPVSVGFIAIGCWWESR